MFKYVLVLASGLLFIGSASASTTRGVNEITIGCTTGVLGAVLAIVIGVHWFNWGLFIACGALIGLPFSGWVCSERDFDWFVALSILSYATLFVAVGRYSFRMKASTERLS